MPLNPQDIERLKTGIDLASYIASRGIALNKNGRNHKGLCPFHEEKEPSFTVNPIENLWHCFGCGAGGDVFTFVERLDKVSFTRAVGIVGKSAGKVNGEKQETPSTLPSKPAEDTGLRFTPQHQKLLNRVVQFYQQELWKDRRGLNYLKQRGLTDKQSLIDFGVGFVSGTLLEMLPSDGDYEAALKQIGILNERGHEMFYGSVVFPLLDFSAGGGSASGGNNNCVGLYGRRIDEEQVKHLYLPGPRRGLVNRQAAKWFSKVVSQLTNEREELIREDLNRVLTRIESYKPVKEKKERSLTAEEKEEALAFLQSPDLFDQILADLEHLGCTGEETNKLVAYLVSVSRKMEEPLALLIRSRSAAGKSTLQDTILSLVPEEDSIKYTRLTDQALFYKEENSLVHKLLAIEEAAGVGGSAYSIRALQSSKQLTVATTSKDPTTGKMKTEEYTVNGPLALMLTTTSVDLDPEMESRFLTIAIDESKEMTEKIHQKQRELDTLEGYLTKKKSEFCRKKHQNAQRLLKPLAIVNPYAPYLNFPSENLRSRRDHKKYLNLIKACAFTCQHQRLIKEFKVGSETVSYIEVTVEDIERANKLANDVLGRSLDDLSGPSRSLLGLIHEMVKNECQKHNLSFTDFSFNRRIVREYAKWSDWQVKTHIRELEDLGFVYSRMGSKGKEYVYELHHEVPAQPSKKIYLGLTEASQLEKVMVNLEGEKEYLVAL